MMRRTPFDEMDRLFDTLSRSMWSGLDREWYAGNIRLETDDDGYVVIADLPGFESDEIDLRFDDGTLSIRADHEVSEEDDSDSMTIAKFQRRRFHEEFVVPEDSDVIVDEISATYQNGVLEVHLPVVGAVDDVEDDGHRIEID